MTGKRPASYPTDEPSAKREKSSHHRTFTLGHDKVGPWHGNDAILMAFRQKDLYNNGFIASPFAPIDGDIRVSMGKDDPHIPSGLMYEIIHPIFRRQNWVGISDADYTLMEPALRLASYFLQEPSIFHWWMCLNEPPTLLDDAKLKLKTGDDIYQIKLRPIDMAAYSDKFDTLAAWRRLHDLQDYVRWRFGGEIPSGWASTTSWKNPATGNPFDGMGTVGYTFASEVRLRQEYLDIFRGTVDPNNFPKARWHTDEELSAKAMFVFATTLTHEVCHVFHNATRETFSHALHLFREPFIDDYRVNELGSTFESHVFGGVIQGSGNNSTEWANMPSWGNTGPTAAGPYGMQLFRWPGDQMFEYAPGEYRVVQRATPTYWGEWTHITYALPIEYIYQFFSKKFWQQTVPALGLAAYKPNLSLGVNVFTKNPDWSPSEISEMQPRALVDPLPPVPSQDVLRDQGWRIKEHQTADSDESDEEEELLLHPMGLATGDEEVSADEASSWTFGVATPAADVGAAPEVQGGESPVGSGESSDDVDWDGDDELAYDSDDMDVDPVDENNVEDALVWDPVFSRFTA